LIGMVGIIINDSIVLVTTIDEYSKERGLFPAILDGVTDRLRPVLLTTLTTVLGLSPLLYETSSAAQFLKPTVITLVYGLGFGVVLVLIVVPALMAMQADVGAQVASFKRAWRGLSRGRGPRLPFAAAVVLVLAVFAMTLGSVMFNGGLPTLVLGLPMAAVLAPLQMGFVLFLVGSACVLVAVYALSALVLALQLKR
jgi:predicted RND superfamily exporter protein